MELKKGKNQTDEEFERSLEQIKEPSKQAKSIIDILGEYCEVKMLQDDPENIFGHKVEVELTLAEHEYETRMVDNFKKVRDLGFYVGNIGYTCDEHSHVFKLKFFEE